METVKQEDYELELKTLAEEKINESEQMVATRLCIEHINELMKKLRKS